MSKRTEIAKRVSQETYDKVKKQMSCKWYCNGGDCKKGLPGTKCELTKCVAWEENKASIYDFGLAGIGIMQDAYSILVDAAKSLVDAVEKYVNPKKGEYLHRSELLIKVKELKEILK